MSKFDYTILYTRLSDGTIVSSDDPRGVAVYGDISSTATTVSSRRRRPGYVRPIHASAAAKRTATASIMTTENRAGVRASPSTGTSGTPVTGTITNVPVTSSHRTPETNSTCPGVSPIVATGMRVPVMQGTPAMTRWSTEIRSKDIPIAYPRRLASPIYSG